MNAALVADYLSNIPDVLHNFGIRIAAHVSGRDDAPAPQRTALPSRDRAGDPVLIFSQPQRHAALP